MGRWDRNKEVDLVPAVHLGQEEVKKQDWGRRRRRKEKMGRWRKREKWIKGRPLQLPDPWAPLEEKKEGRE